MVTINFKGETNIVNNIIIRHGTRIGVGSAQVDSGRIMAAAVNIVVDNTVPHL